MTTPPIPHNENERLAILRECRILDTQPDPRFDRLTRMAAALLQCPIALVSLVDECRQWFKSTLGLDATETAREISFCAHAIVGSEILEVPDARLDKRFADNPAVTGEPGVVFYCGAPIYSEEGYALGTLCVVDRVPRQLTTEQRTILRDLADCVGDQIHLGRMIIDSQLLAKNRRLSAAIARAQALFIGDYNQQDVFDELLQELLNITDSESGFIGEVILLDGLPHLVKTYACRGDAAECTESERKNTPPVYLAGLLDAVIAAGKPLILNNSETVTERLHGTDTLQNLRTLMGIPIFLGQQMIAVLGVANRPGGYDEELREFIQPLLNTVAQLVDAVRSKRLHEDREQEVRRLSLVASQTDSGVLMTRTDGGIDWINEGFVRISGHALNTLHGARFWDVLSGPDTEPEKIDTLQQAFYGCRAFTLELLCNRKNGSTYWARITGNPLYEEDRRFNGYICIISDISNERRKSDLLRDNERRLRAVIEGTRIGTWEWNIATGSMTFNERWAAIVGYRLADLEPTRLETWVDLIHPEDYAESRGILDRHFAGELDFYDCKYRMKHRLGHWVWVHDRGRVFSWSTARNPLMMSGTHADITDLMEAQINLEREKNKLSSLYQMAPVGIASSDLLQGSFVEANPELLAILNYDMAALRKLRWSDVTPGKYADEDQRKNAELLHSGRCGPYEKQLVRRTGEIIEVAISGVRVQELSGEDRVWTIVQNISEQKQLEKMKSELIAVVSHELRTPLTSIIGALGLLRRSLEKETLPSRFRDLVDIAFNNGHRLNMLINDLLDMEKLMAGKMAFKVEVLAVTDLLEQALRENGAYAQQYDVHLVIAENSQHCSIAVDRLRFQQVASNLLSNAVKFSPAGGEVVLSWSLQADSVRIEVIDHGCGIPAEFHSRVFQRFTQVDASTTRKKEGTGLGLAITRELVERMNGAIGFHSEPGIGTTFFMTFPIVSAAPNQGDL